MNRLNFMQIVLMLLNIWALYVNFCLSLLVAYVKDIFKYWILKYINSESEVSETDVRNEYILNEVLLEQQYTFKTLQSLAFFLEEFFVVVAVGGILVAIFYTRLILYYIGVYIMCYILRILCSTILTIKFYITFTTELVNFYSSIVQADSKDADLAYTADIVREVTKSGMIAIIPVGFFLSVYLATVYLMAGFSCIFLYLHANKIKNVPPPLFHDPLEIIIDENIEPRYKKIYENY